MLLKKLKEARTAPSDKALAEEIKSKDSSLKDLRIETILNIIKIFKSEVITEVTADNVIDWFDESPSFADFVFFYGDELSTYSISDFVQHDEKLANAVRKVLKDYKIIDDEDHDLSLTYDKDEKPSRAKLSLERMCVILFNELTSVPVKKEPSDDGEQGLNSLSDKTKFDPEKFSAILSEVEEAYKSLYEEVEQGKVCEKCGKFPCECDKETLHEEDNISTEQEPSTSSETITTEETPTIELDEAAFTSLVNDNVQKAWDLVNNLNSAVATFDYNYKEQNKEDIKALLSQIIDDVTIDIGMLYKVNELISSESTELLASGAAKAEEIITD